MPNKTVAFGLNPEQPDDTYSLGGDWAIGTQNAYQLVDKPAQERRTMTLTYSPGISAFTFTFTFG